MSQNQFRFVRVPFGVREFFIWSSWYVVSTVCLLLWMPFLTLFSLPSIFRNHPLYVLFWFCLGSDFLLKRYFMAVLDGGRVIEVIPDLFTLTLVFNKGAAFGMLKGWGWLFIFMAVITCVFIFFYLGIYRQEDKLISLALTMILAGAIGNMVDRVYYGHVVDYLLFYWKSYSWPVFNFADVVINVGVFLILADLILEITGFRKGKR